MQGLLKSFLRKAGKLQKSLHRHNFSRPMRSRSSPLNARSRSPLRSRSPQVMRSRPSHSPLRSRSPLRCVKLFFTHHPILLYLIKCLPRLCSRAADYSDPAHLGVVCTLPGWPTGESVPLHQSVPFLRFNVYPSIAPPLSN